MMNNRRDFLKTTGKGVVVVGVSGTGLAEAFQHKYEDAEKNEKVSLKVTAPLFCPYHSISTPEEKGGGAPYLKSVPFTHNPFTINASGMSGSPVIMDAKGTFVGFMTSFGGEQSTFSFDGKETLTVNAPAGQELYIDERGNSDRAWKEYNTEMMKRLNIEPLKKYPDFWSDVEYCTWGEQKWHEKEKQGQDNLLLHQYVSNYLDKIIEYGYPKGKLTLDVGCGCFPDATINAGFALKGTDPKMFPDLRKALGVIQEKGFIPGLCIGFSNIHAHRLIANNNPNVLSHGNVGNRASEFGKLNTKATISDYAPEVIGRLAEMGVKKFKIDVPNISKTDLLYRHKALYCAAKNIDPTIEMEFCVPDIFFSKYTDLVGSNDVCLNDKYNWAEGVRTHYAIAFKSSPGRGIKFGHIGGNLTAFHTETKYLQHLEMYKGMTGSPRILGVPHYISAKCVEETGAYLWDYKHKGKKIISDFYV